MNLRLTLQQAALALAINTPAAALAQTQPTPTTPTVSPEPSHIEESFFAATPPNPTHPAYPLSSIRIGVGAIMPFADPEQSGGRIDFQLTRGLGVRFTVPRWGFLPEKLRGSPVPISFTPYMALQATRDTASAAAGMLVHFFPPNVLSLYVGATAVVDLHYPQGNTPLSVDLGGDAIAGFQFRVVRDLLAGVQLNVPFLRENISGTPQTNLAAAGSVFLRF